MARPSEYTPEIASKICEELATGKSLRTVCLPEEMPHISTIFNWFNKFPSFVEQYARAKEESADALTEKMLQIAEDAPSVIVGGEDRADNARVSAEKLRIDTYKWIASKMKPKKYGEKLDLTSGGEKLPTPIFGGKSTTEEPV